MCEIEVDEDNSCVSVFVSQSSPEVEVRICYQLAMWPRPSDSPVLRLPFFICEMRGMMIVPFHPVVVMIKWDKVVKACSLVHAQWMLNKFHSSYSYC